MIPDAQLLERFAIQRDPEAFADLMRRHAGMVYGTCLRVLGGDTHAAEDSTQDSFLALAQYAHQVRGNLIGWLHRTAIRAALRRRSAVKTTTEGLDTIPVADQDRERAELLERLDQAMNQLPADMHEILVLRFLEGMPQEAIAERLGNSQATIHRRIERGLSKLRQMLAPDESRSGALGLALGAVFVEPPAQVLTNLGRLALTTLPTAAPVAATVGMGTWVAIAATGLLTVGIAVKSFWPTAPVSSPVMTPVTMIAAPVSATTAAVIQDLILTPRGSDAEIPFAELLRKGGPRVTVLGRKPTLIVPADLRFKSIAGRELITAVAASRNLSIAWMRDGTTAVLYAGCTDAEIEQLRKDLTATEASQRSEAAWRAGWLADPRAVSLLVTAANDNDLAVAGQAVASLRRLSWESVVFLDERSHVLLEKECTSQHFYHCTDAISALPFMGGDKVLTLLEKALVDQNTWMRCVAVHAVSRVGVDKALPFLEKALVDRDNNVRQSAVDALGIVGSDKVLPLLEKALVDNSVRRSAIYALGGVGGDKAAALLERILANGKSDEREYAARTLFFLGGDKAMILLEKTFHDNDSNMRRIAVSALGYIGGNKALALLKKALTDPEVQVRKDAVSALGSIGGDTAVTLLEKVLVDDEASVRKYVVQALGNVGGDKALALLENALADHDIRVRMNGAQSLGNIGGDKAVTLLEKALIDQDSRVRHYAASSLKMIRSDRALALLEKALTDQDASLRRSAAHSLGYVGACKAMALLEKAFADQDASVRANVVQSLGYMGGDRALVLLEKALADQDASVRGNAAASLGRIGGGDKIRDLLVTWLGKEDSTEAVQSSIGMLSTQFAKDPVMVKAITDARTRLTLNGTPPKKPSPTNPTAPKAVTPPKTGVDDF